ncbi:hypothetical protein CRUP_006595, partial [Coryphaenoides rupestris]
MGLLRTKKLCKFCDVKLTNCTGVGSCDAGCEITSICPHIDEVCVTV